MDMDMDGGGSWVTQQGNTVLVEARLQGGAPWGFTLKGGLEHGEPLIISKVEEGGKAGLLQFPLQVGDEVVIINGVELSGFRQEAISLVKGSYKALQLTVRRECCGEPCCADSRPLTPSSCQRGRRDRCSGVQLRIQNRRSEPGSRPHSWHSTKLGEGPLDPDSMMQISQGAMGAPWHQSYHSSASTTDLSSYDAGFLRKSPDQYSSRGSMESLDHPHPVYSSCNQLSASKSSSSIDHLHSKRDSAYSSFSTSSSIPEYLAAAPSISKERSYSMDSVPQHRMAEGMHQADIRYVRTVYDSQQGGPEEHEVSSAALMKTNDSKSHSRSGSIQGGICHRANSSSGSSGSSGSSSGGTTHRHSVGPVWGHNRNSYENLKGAPAPPLRSDSYAAIRNHERPNSWSSLEQARSLRALHKGSWHHSSGSVASGKSSFGIEGQLHTVIEKSPESSPTIKPKQNFPASSQPGRAILPTGVYPVPLPEPHFAQIPTNNTSSSSVYPALAKESRNVPHRDSCGGSDSGVRTAVENGHQAIPSYPSSVQSHTSAQSKQTNQAQDDLQSKCVYKPHLQPPFTGQERRDPYTPVQPRGERPRYSHGMDIMETYRQPREEDTSRSLEQSIHSQPVLTSLKVAQGQVAQPHRGNMAQVTQGSDQRNNSVGRLHSDSSIYQQKDADLDHPLTRLENALAEVQRCASPQSTASQCSFQSERSMSVLEKVSHFERKHVKPRSHSSLSSYSSSVRQVSRPAKSSLSGLEDLQNNSYIHGRNRSASALASFEDNTEEQLDGRRRYGGIDQTHHWKPHDLHRSKSSFQLGEGNDQDFHRCKSTFQLGEENGKDIQWKDDLQDILGTVQDTSFNRAYRDSIKDAQSKVLRSTSFRRRDLNVNPPPVPAKHMSLERKGPKTCPKPTTSPHTPKERHVVPVDPSDRSIPPELPSVSPVGPPIMRICGRKRLTMEQKKMSYSEPENMNEIGISDQESGLFFQKKIQLQFPLPETSVADKRRMFELAASRCAGPKPASSRSDLKQIQQDALAEYVERKTGRRMDSRLHRPQSAYMPSTSSSSTDSQSLTSTPSLCSLQEPGPEGISGVGRQSTSLSANIQRSFYPNRGPQVLPEMYPAQRPQGQTVDPQKLEPERPFPVHPPAISLHHFRTDNFPENISAVFERAAPSRSSGKSASAEDLLEHTEARSVPQHFRSRSSPAVENFSQDFLTRDLRMFGIVSKGPPESRALSSAAPEQGLERSSPSGQTNSIPTNVPVICRERQRHSDRPRSHSAAGLAASVGLPCPFSPPGSHSASETQYQPNLDAITFPGSDHVSPSSSFEMTEIAQNSGDHKGSGNFFKDAPRPKTSELLPSRQEARVTESQAPSFPDPAAPLSSLGLPPPTTPTSPSSPTKPLLSLRISESSINFPPPPSPSPPLPPPPPLPEVSQEVDDVFLVPPSPTPTPLPIRETDIMEDFPPPCSPFPPQTRDETRFAAPPQQPWRLNSTVEYQPVSQEWDGQLRDLSTSSAMSAAANVISEAEILRQIPDDKSREEEEEEKEEKEASEVLGLVSPLLVRRERSVAELQVEILARELVKRDEALTSLLDAWVSTITLDLMENTFPTYLTPSQHSRNNSSGAPDGVNVTADACVKAVLGGMETDLDEEESDLNQKKVELLEALAASLEVLHEERSRLAEAQQRYRSLGSSMEALVQQRCKPNEIEKYRMFIGDLEKIVSLLLSLSGRLARVENALSCLDDKRDQDSTEERESLEQKRRQLCSQQEDAHELKENVDRRERVVLDFLSGYLTAEQLHLYQQYVRAKPALLIRQRHLDELIRHGEEQLHRLSTTLPSHCLLQRQHPHASPTADDTAAPVNPVQALNAPTQFPRPTTAVTSL